MYTVFFLRHLLFIISFTNENLQLSESETLKKRYLSNCHDRNF